MRVGGSENLGVCGSDSLRIWGSEGLRIWGSEVLSVWVFEVLRVCGLKVWGYEGLRVWGSEGLSVWVFKVLRVCGLRVWGSDVLRVWGSAGMRVWGSDGGCRQRNTLTVEQEGIAHSWRPHVGHRPSWLPTTLILWWLAFLLHTLYRLKEEDSPHARGVNRDNQLFRRFPGLARFVLLVGAVNMEIYEEKNWKLWQLGIGAAESLFPH